MAVLDRMTDHSKQNIFGLPLGSETASAFVAGFPKFCEGLTQSQIARAQIFVNTARMQRALRDAFDAGPDTLVPRIRLLTDIPAHMIDGSVANPVSPLKQKLEVSQLISKLLDSAPDLAPRSALFPLTESLMSLLNEMAEEGVSLDDLNELDVSDQSGHWSRTLEFLRIASPLFEGMELPGAVQQHAVEHLVSTWAASVPDHPVIVLGSTGSRRTTRTLMKAVAGLPYGAVILPGFDRSMPEHVWSNLGETNNANSDLQEDHPQFRFWNLLQEMALGINDVRKWPNCDEARPEFNRFISLSLRPAPITDAWMTEGPSLGDLKDITANLSLVEAQSPKLEAEAIALRMRYALQDRKSVALISPDRNLTRQVAASLDRWDLVPDDSAGIPLSLSPPGRLFGHAMDLFDAVVSADKLIALLKHPIVHTGSPDRGKHLLRVREFELALRRSGTVIADQKTIERFAATQQKSDPEIVHWSTWLHSIAAKGNLATRGTLQSYLNQHLGLAELLSKGSQPDDVGELWLEAEGRAIELALKKLSDAAGAAGVITKGDYKSFLVNYLNGETVRNQNNGRPDLLILGTLESRVQSADIVILGGLNDGIWPPSPTPDPWLNRKMRRNLGLLSFDRKIGLSAHDYQQAISSKEVVITRSLRTADSETVPSRWLNRLTNLLSGLPTNLGPDALQAMKARGDMWVDAARDQLSVSDAPKPASRPSPQPPTDHRPKQLSVTKIKTLIRDPYAVYAEKLLRLIPLNQLSVRQEYQLRGVLFHKILQDFIEAELPASAERELKEIADAVLEEGCPWPLVRLQWQSLIQAIIPSFLSQEATRSQRRVKSYTEVSGKLSSDLPNFTLVGIADRIDLTSDGQAAIYDYKTGNIPTKSQQLHFDKQLLMEAVMLERGAFDRIAETQVSEAKFLGFGSKVSEVPAPLDEVSPSQVWIDLLKLIENWNRQERGYSARIAMFRKSDIGNYDHLSRYGEWSVGDAVAPEAVE